MILSFFKYFCNLEMGVDSEEAKSVDHTQLFRAVKKLQEDLLLLGEWAINGECTLRDKKILTSHISIDGV